MLDCGEGMQSGARARAPYLFGYIYMCMLHVVHVHVHIKALKIVKSRVRKALPFFCYGLVYMQTVKKNPHLSL